MQSAQYAAALKLLAPYEDSQAGNVEFDYLLGVTALETGDASRATIVLERALIVNPNHAGARLDLARAYFALGDRERARTEFNAALVQDPPVNARAAINAYLARIDGGSSGTDLVGSGMAATRMAGYLEFMAGRDTNVNNATSQGQIFVPVFGFSVQLAPTSLRTPDNFLSLGGGGEISHALNASTSLFAGGDARLRRNQHTDTYSYNQFDVRGGLQHALSAATLVRVSVAHQQYYLDHNNYRGASGLNLEWRHAPSEKGQFSVFGSGSRVRYKDTAQTANDVDLGVLGAGYTHALNTGSRTLVSVSAVAGHERDVGQRIDGDRKLYGLRAGAQTGWGARVDLYASAGYQQSRYQSDNVVFMQKRSDNQTDLALGAVWRLTEVWQLRPQLTYTRNASNIDIYAYTRYEASITLRRDFK